MFDKFILSVSGWVCRSNPKYNRFSLSSQESMVVVADANEAEDDIMNICTYNYITFLPIIFVYQNRYVIYYQQNCI